MEQRGRTVKAFDEDLDHLGIIIARMGGIAEAQLAAAVEALVGQDSERAQMIVVGDKEIDALEREVDEFAIRLLALRQPMADDLRRVIAALKIAADIERIGDYAKNIAKRTMALEAVNEVPLARPLASFGILVQGRIKQVLDAYARGDTDVAMTIRDGDCELDEAHNALYETLQKKMMADPMLVPVCCHLLFVAKALERIGDLVTNIAELVYFVARGKSPAEERRKGDSTSVTLLDARSADG